ncbi:MAG: ABC transporter substrate-binding protein, partial [Chloroflexota bacterium]
MFNKRWAIGALVVLVAAVVLAACSPEVVTETVEVEVTRVVTETVEVEGETVEVTVVETVVEEVEVVVEVTAEPEEEPSAPKDLIVCMAQEPQTLYTYGNSMLAQRAVQHAFEENNFETKSYGYQARGIEKIPSLADGDAVINVVEVAAGDTVVDAAGEVVVLEDGMMITNSDGENVEFAGSAMMEQMVVDFTMKARVWSDGVAVTASDSVYSFNVAADPDTPSSKFTTDRTASYEANGDLGLVWTGVPGYLDSTYFTNIWQPLPEHHLGGFSAAELLEAEESSRTPIGDGPYKIDEWVAGDSIVLSPNEFYYEGAVPLNSVTYKFIPDTNQLIAQLLSGSCDIGTQDGMGADQSPFLIEAESSGLLTPY